MEETTLFFYFFSECMCNYCHTPVTPCHPRQGRRGGDDEEGRGRRVVGSSGSPRFRKEGRRIKRRGGKKQESLLIRHFLSRAEHWYPNDSRRDADITRREWRRRGINTRAETTASKRTTKSAQTRQNTTWEHRNVPRNPSQTMFNLNSLVKVFQAKF